LNVSDEESSHADFFTPSPHFRNAPRLACGLLSNDVGIKGRAYAYVELVGYDRSHESPSLVTFLFGSALDRGWRSIFG
jgi:hypothetical protein